MKVAVAFSLGLVVVAMLAVAVTAITDAEGESAYEVCLKDKAAKAGTAKKVEDLCLKELLTSLGTDKLPATLKSVITKVNGEVDKLFKGLKDGAKLDGIGDKIKGALSGIKDTIAGMLKPKA